MDWLEPPEVAVPGELYRVVGGDPLVAEILARRGITDPATARAFLDPRYYTPSPPEELPDLTKAASRLHEGIQRGERMLVWGDFDVDGQTSTALLVDALRTLGADVRYHIPHRLKHGHGVHADVLVEYIRRGIDLVLTCDTGVAAHEAVEAAQVNGVTMLITDHHALPPRLPDAPAIVNPQRLPEGHPLRDLPGVGVAYKLVQYLYRLAGREADAQRFLDLVALGIVADVATQRLDTRYLLQLGMDSLRNPRRIGLRALMASAQVDISALSTDTIGYQVGPRLNALGRLGDASLAVELLTTDNEARAAQIASQLELLNNKRKQIEDQIYGAAQAQIVAEPSLLNFEALVLAGQDWHPGVIGIVASRLVEQYDRPAVLLSLQEGQPARGSARSVPGVNIGACIAANADLLISYGGHPGAAGLVLDPDLIPQFRRRLSNTVAERRDPEARSGYPVDAVVPPGDLSMELAEELNRLAPFGEGNPPVHLMAPGVRLVSYSGFGVNNRHRRVTIEDEAGNEYTVTWWRGSEHPAPPSAFDLLYIPRINDYKGRRSLQLEWVDHRAVPGVEAEVGPRYEVVDLREEPDPALAVDAEEYAVWVEGVSSEGLPFEPEQVGTRATLPPARALVIWTAPPGPQELAQVLARTGATLIYVVARAVPDTSAEAFLKRLGGLVKYALREYGGEVSLLRLAGATAQREFAVRQGLEWMAAGGKIEIEWLEEDRLRFRRGGQGQADRTALEPLLDSLRASLEETAAFRRYFRRSDPARFFHPPGRFD
ncbi:MAG TPA: single-stranded-DNA-specific exonuclease RecJ [Chloroflexi bacterium]|nr:single-stranded-DNA-specific exonuclease RecJ [Chloroflexota bacterium]